MSMDKLITIGLSEQKAKETLKNPSLSSNLTKIIELAEKHSKNGLSGTVGTFLYHIATRLKPQCYDNLPLLVKHVVDGGIKTETQFAASLEFLLSHLSQSFTDEDFKQACGVGVEVAPEVIEQKVEIAIDKHKEGLLRDRYAYNVGKILGELRNDLKWADGQIVKSEVDLQVLSLLGPKTMEDLERKNAKMKPPAKSDKTKATSKPKAEDKKAGGKPVAAEDQSDEGASTIAELMKTKIKFHKPGENYKTEGYVVTPNTMELLKKHLAKTKGKVITRFPPEPNGLLHIGHAKAINIDFGYAEAHDGVCYLRYDDTNPEKEEEKFFTGILDVINWLGYKPYKITHSSDYFDQLYQWAKVLIGKGLAYVCHQSADDMKGIDAPVSPWQNRPVQESMQLFQDMKHGKFDEGQATLRLKLTLEEGKVDPVAYRIKFVAHHRTGNKWCIYPTYDYTHCLCDSIEQVTHSLCTKEFQSRRSSYYWLCNALDIYCPVQWEYGRLNMDYTVVSKRKIQKLIDSGTVTSWDDPRLFTLTALRRRGFPPEAINNFIARMGVTMARVAVDPQMLDASVRDVLNVTAPRAMAVLTPLEIRVTNLAILNLPKTVSVPDFPSEPERGQHNVPLSDVMYIEAEDFKENADKNYRRLTLAQSVGLKHVGLVLKVVSVNKNTHGEISSLDVAASPVSDQNKPKAFIQWVSDPVKCQIRQYGRLFHHKNPEDPSEVPGGFITDCDKNSLVIIENGLVDRSVVNAKHFDKFQFERIGFFSVDPDSTDKKLVFNRTVLLKEDAGKS